MKSKDNLIWLLIKKINRVFEIFNYFYVIYQKEKRDYRLILLTSYRLYDKILMFDASSSNRIEKVINKEICTLKASLV